MYWTDLKNERVLMSQRDPGPEILDILLSKLTAPGERPFIKHVKAHHSVLISTVAGNAASRSLASLQLYRLGRASSFARCATAMDRPVWALSLTGGATTTIRH